MEKPLSELIADARYSALQARWAALRLSDDDRKRDWTKIATMWELVAKAYEGLGQLSLPD